LPVQTKNKKRDKTQKKTGKREKTPPSLAGGDPRRGLIQKRNPRPCRMPTKRGDEAKVAKENSTMFSRLGEGREKKQEEG